MLIEVPVPSASLISSKAFRSLFSVSSASLLFSSTFGISIISALVFSSFNIFVSIFSIIFSGTLAINIGSFFLLFYFLLIENLALLLQKSF